MTPTARQATSTDLARLHKQLLAHRAQLDTERQAHLGGQSRAEHAREVLLQDGDDAPQRDADRELDLARTDRDAVTLAEIDAALTRLDQGLYGQCTDCGQNIPVARLDLAPQAARCVACESQLERGQPQPSRL